MKNLRASLFAIAFSLVLGGAASATEMDMYWLGGTGSNGQPIWIPVSTANPIPTTTGGCPIATTLVLGCIKPDGVTITVNGSGVASAVGSAASLTVGASPIADGTTTRVLFDNAGVLGEYAITGTGSVVMSISPTLVTPALGTPTAIVLTNGTGLPVAGLTGLGAGVGTALGVNIGSAGAPVLFNGAGGTPSSLGLANATGLTVPGGGTGAATLTAAGLVLAHGTSPFTALAEVDGDCVVGATGAWTAATCPGGTPANPSATAGPTAVNGSASTYMRSDGAPAVQKASNAQFGIMEGDGQTVCVTTGVAAACVSSRKVTTSPTVLATDMGGQIIMNVTGGGTLTIPAISSTIFPINTTLSVVNFSASTAAVSTTPTVNAGGGCVTGTGIPSGDTWQIFPDADGTTLDCFQTISAGGGGGSGTVSSGTVGQIGVYASSGATISGQTVASGVVLKGQGAAVPVASAIADNGSNVAIAEAALTTPVALTDGATIATNAALSNVFSVTIAGNRTLSNPTNLVAGQFITWQLKEDATGSRTLALDTDFNLINGGTFAMNSAANAKTTLSCFVDTTSTLQCAGGAPLSTITTGSNCSSSAAPAVCGSASGGSVAVPTGTNPTLTVNTTAVTANSQIIMNIDESLGTRLSVTCNTTLTTLTNPVITARTPGTSFTVQIGATIAVNPACASFVVVN